MGVVLGCGRGGPATYPVAGVVNFDGAPIPDGYVVLTPENRSEAPAAGPIVDGKFSFQATAGPKIVEVEASRFVGPENPVMGLRPREPYIPEQYNRESTLRAEVKPDGDNSFVFDLKSAPNAP